MTRLRTAKLAGVEGKRRYIEIETGTGPHVVPAVVYGQWAIHRYNAEHTVTHVPSGLAAADGIFEDRAQRLVAGLLAVREFKTTRAKAAIEHSREVYQAWKRGL